LEKDFNVFIDDVVGKKLLEQYSDFFAGKNFKVFLLLPSLESLLERFDDRGDNKDLRARTIELHKKFTDNRDVFNWHVINSSEQSLEETVDEIYKKLK